MQTSLAIVKYTKLFWTGLAVTTPILYIQNLRKIPDKHPYVFDAIEMARTDPTVSAYVGRVREVVPISATLDSLRKYAKCTVQLKGDQGTVQLMVAGRYTSGSDDEDDEDLDLEEKRGIMYYWDHPWEVKDAVLQKVGLGSPMENLKEQIATAEAEKEGKPKKKDAEVPKKSLFERVSSTILELPEAIAYFSTRPAEIYPAMLQLVGLRLPLALDESKRKLYQQQEAWWRIDSALLSVKEGNTNVPPTLVAFHGAPHGHPDAGWRQRLDLKTSSERSKKWLKVSGVIVGVCLAVAGTGRVWSAYKKSLGAGLAKTFAKRHPEISKLLGGDIVVMATEGVQRSLFVNTKMKLQGKTDSGILFLAASRMGIVDPFSVVRCELRVGKRVHKLNPNLVLNTGSTPFQWLKDLGIPVPSFASKASREFTRAGQK